MPLFLVALLAVSLHVQDPSQARIECRAWQECRQFALDAAARQDFETFHDLAWRAVQTGPKHDAALMYLLARAQSLSGRPGDALVMLQRLAQMGVQTDAATNEDFRRVRALPAWSELENDRSFRNDSSFRLKAEATKSVEAGSSRPTSPPSPTPAAEPRDDVKRTETSPAASPTTGPVESLRFTTAPFTPAGLAYDAVSRRFIVGDRDARKLAVVDEFSQHVANLASAQSTGFGQIAALEIDPRLGNLWVVSADDPQTTLHKLQLVSGRSLGRYELAGRFGAARFTDVAATSDGTVLVLDTAGHRLFRLDAKGQALELAATLPDQHATSLAPGPNDVVYVADRGNKRIQVFTPDGKFIAEQFVGLDSNYGLQARGVAFSPDQRFLYVGGTPVVYILNRRTLEILGSFRTGQPDQAHPPGHQVGSDKQGNVYVVQAELTGAEGKDGEAGGTGALKFTFKGYSPTVRATN